MDTRQQQQNSSNNNSGNDYYKGNAYGEEEYDAESGEPFIPIAKAELVNANENKHQGHDDHSYGISSNEMAERIIRHGFIRKVYGILVVQLLATFGIMCIFMFVDSIRMYVQLNNWVYWTAFGISLAAIIAISCSQRLIKTYPWNYVMLGIYTISMGVLLGVIAAYYTINAILIAVGITALVTVAVSIFACQTRFDFTGMGPYLLVFLMVLILLGIFALIFQDQVLNVVYASLGAVLFCFYLIYDTQLIVGKRKNEFGVDSYIEAALALYLDIINLFLMILTLSGRN